MLTILRLLLILVGLVVGPGCIRIPNSWAVTNVPDPQLINAREKYCELMNHSPSGSAKYAAWVNADPELHAFLGAYHIATAVRPAQRGELRFVILDEQGVPLSGVRVEVRGISGHDAHLEPTGTRRQIVVNGECRLKWTHRGPLELDISKQGYRHINVAFDPQAPNAQRRYTMAMDMLQAGYVLPPETKDGPIRIMLPAAMRWMPEEPGGYEAWKDRPAFRPDRRYWPKAIPANAPVVVTSTEDRLVVTPARGTYALVNRDGALVDLVQLDYGNDIGFLGLMSIARASGQSMPAKEGPYEWRLYSVTKPLAATTQP